MARQLCERWQRGRGICRYPLTLLFAHLFMFERTVPGCCRYFVVFHAKGCTGLAVWILQRFLLAGFELRWMAL